MVKIMRFLVIAFALGWTVLWLDRAWGESERRDTDRIEVDADKLDYDRGTGWIEAHGHVVVRKGDQELRADYVQLDRDTGDAHASGNVVLIRADEVWNGENLHGNLRTKIWNIERLTGSFDPVHVIEVEKAVKGPDDLCVLHTAMVTTCSNKYPHCHYYVRAKKIDIVPGEYIKARGVVWYFGRVPVLYMPYWYRNLKEDFGFRFYPGYNSRMGAFLLSSYKYRMSPSFRAETHADYRSRRGFAVGQDYKWRGTEGGWFGDLSVYYADDRRPVDDDEDPETADIKNDRYRIRLKHNQNMSDRDYMLMQVHYLSDTDILEDFFEDEYRESHQPENYLAYTHRGNRFAANLILRARLNDFYSNINRLPDCSLDFMRQQIGRSPLYYEGETAAAFLEKVYKASETNEEDYSVYRVDASHMLYCPGRFFGFLNMIPRAGYRGTWYSETIETITTLVTNIVPLAEGDTNNVSGTTYETNTVSTDVERGGDFRSRFEVGLETSFKTFRTWGGEVRPRRHIVEPYAGYTFVPEPSLLRDNIYRFDSVDRLDEEHNVSFGVRNKLQTKQKGHPFDLVDVDVYTRYKIERDADEEAVDNIFLDAELRPANWLAIDFDAAFDVAASSLADFNSRAVVSHRESWTADLEYRFKNEQSGLVLGNLTLFPNRNWTFNAYGRYEFEADRIEEQGGYIQRNFDCMVIRTGLSAMPGYTRSDGSEKDDEVRIIVEFWLTAFPQVTLAGRHRN